MLDMAPVGKANGQRQQAGGEAGPQAPGVGGQCPPVTPRAEPRLLRAAWPRAVGMRGHRADQEEGGRPGSDRSWMWDFFCGLMKMIQN